MKRPFCRLAAAAACAAAISTAFAEPSEITVDLRLDHIDFVDGERVHAVVDVANLSPDTVSVGYADSADRLFIEVFRSSDKSQMEHTSGKAFVAPFLVKPNEGQKLGTWLGDHYGLRNHGRYLAKPVLVHGGVRFEGQMRAFDIVPGMRVCGALQIFSNHEGLRREFELVNWRRGGADHLFMKSADAGSSDRKWATMDIGPMMKITKPTISIMPGGEVVVLHRVDADAYLRSEFWSVPEGVLFAKRELVQDPETAGANRVREIYRETGGVQPKENPWWKFW